MVDVETQPRSSTSPAVLKIANQGPDYFRRRVLARDGDMERKKSCHRKSAVELLEASKAMYVKTEEVRERRQLPRNAQVLQVSGVTSASVNAAASPASRNEVGQTGSGRAGVVSGRQRCLSTGSVEPVVGGRSVAATPAVTVNAGTRHRNSLNEGKSMSKSCSPDGPHNTRTSSSVDHSSRTVASVASSQGRKPVPPPVPPKPTNTHSQKDTATDGQEPMAVDRTSEGFSEVTHASSSHSSGLPYQKRPKYNGDLKMDTTSASPVKFKGGKKFEKGASHLNNNGEESGKSGYVPSALSNWRETKTDSVDGESDIDKRSTSASSVCRGDETAPLPVVHRRPKKAISRSRSDIGGHRCSNGSELSDFSARFSRNSADLEKFFNEMGLDRNVLDPMLSTQCSLLSSSDLQLMESVSSVGTPDVHSLCSEDVDGQKQAAAAAKLHEFPMEAIKAGPGGTPTTTTSVVERNARIIKWLCNIKKAQVPPSTAE